MEMAQTSGIALFAVLLKGYYCGDGTEFRYGVIASSSKWGLLARWH